MSHDFVPGSKLRNALHKDHWRPKHVVEDLTFNQKERIAGPEPMLMQHPCDSMRMCGYQGWGKHPVHVTVTLVFFPCSCGRQE